VSTFQVRALAICCWLITLCVGIFGAASYSDYAVYRDGPRVQAIVTGVDRAGATLTYDFRGRPRTVHVRDPELHPGAQVELRLHEVNGSARRASEVSVPVGSTAIVILGVLGSLALGVVLWRKPTLAARRRAARTGPFEAVIEAAARTRNLSLGLGIFFVAAAGFLGIIPVFDREAKTGATIAIEVVAAVSLALAGFVLARAYRLRDPRRNEIVELVDQHPHEIAWFYVHRVVTNGIQASETLSIHLWKTDGKLVALALVREDLDLVLAELERRAPHALQGFSPEHKKLYRAQPTRWRPAA
jgi:hypothetical protein